MRVTVTGALELADAWDEAAARSDEDLRQVVRKGAVNVKKDWRTAWSGFKHAPDLPDAVTFDEDDEAGNLGAEIGPDKSKSQGALGNLLEFGSVNNAPHPGGQPALDAEEPHFERAAGDVAEKLADV
jgi:hypothetical protein